MISQGKVCAQKECSSKGTCVVDQYFFDKDFKNLGYTEIFTKQPCVCDSDRMGHDCSQPYDAAKERAKKDMASKMINWTKMPVKSDFLKTFRFGIYNYEQYRFYNLINMNNQKWAIFPTIFSCDRWKKSVSRYGTYIIAAERELAFETKIVAKPEAWKKS